MNQKQLETLKQNNEDSRFFTRNCIAFGLITLLKREKMNFRDVTVSKLCEVAGVSRAAFYRNYRSIDEVLVDRLHEFGKELTSHMETDVFKNWLWVFKITDANRLLFETLINAGMEHMISNTLIQMVPAEEDNGMIQTIWVSLFCAMIIRWLTKMKSAPINEMARLAYKYTKGIPIVVSE